VLAGVPECFCRILRMVSNVTTATTIPKANVPTETPIVSGSEQHISSSTCKGSGIVKKTKIKV